MIVLVADPPWRFGDSLPGPKRGASSHYSCLSVSEIQRFPLPAWDVGESAVLFLWRVAAMPQEALDVCSAWGFTPKSELVWCKTSSNGAPRIGMGRIVRAAHETCLVATKGRGTVPTARNVPSYFRAPRGEHSAKPDEFYALVERLYPQARKVELFARTRRDGWEQYGDQLPEAAE